MGAWIETYLSIVCMQINLSHPSWVRGLKQKILSEDIMPFWVAPLVGAWIETAFSSYYYSMLLVAPLVGAWIETIIG